MMQRKHLIKEYFIPSNLLVLCLLGFLLVLPLFPVQDHLFIFNSFLITIMISAVLSFDKDRMKHFIVVSILTISIFLAELLKREMLGDLFRIAISFFFIWTVVRLIRQTVRSETVTPRVIADSISGYLLQGVIYVIIVKLVYTQNPDGFRFPDDTGNVTSRFVDLIYFTFVTYTSTGYGDILPVSQFAKALAVLIGISGQLYIAIIIALLVGKFSSGVPGPK